MLSHLSRNVSSVTYVVTHNHAIHSANFWSFIFGREKTGNSFKFRRHQSMADDDSENDVSAIRSPRIIFIRLGKDKSKDAIEDEIFKYISKVLEESNDNGSASEEAKNIITLPDFAGCRIQQVAVGPEYVGLLFDDGRVGRFKCVTKNIDSTKKPWGSQGTADEPSFQVQSDEAYARQLQNEFLSSGATASTYPARSPVFAGSSISFSPNNQLSRNSSRSAVGNGLVTYRTAQRFIPSAMPAANNSIPAAVTRESQTEGVDLDKSSGTNSSLVDSESRGSQADASVQTNSSSKSMDPNNETPTMENALPSTSSKTEKNQEGKTEFDKSKAQNSTNQKQENSAENVPLNGRSVSSSQSSNTRRSVSSPTLLQRTVFTTNYPIMRQFSTPFLFPAGSVSIPLYSSSSNGPIFGSRGSLRLEPRVVRAQLAEAGAFSRGPTTASAQRREDRPPNESKCASCSDADFCYPEIGGVEWLGAENVSELIKLQHLKELKLN